MHLTKTIYFGSIMKELILIFKPYAIIDQKMFDAEIGKSEDGE